jgi:hypothetical protein
VLKFHAQKCKKMAVILGYFSHICSIFLLIEDLCLKNKKTRWYGYIDKSRTVPKLGLF